MKKLIYAITFILLNFSNNVFAEETHCNEFKKFSMEFFKCKGNLLKDKSISVGQNIVKNTKDYQEKEWNSEKKKLENAKKKVNEVKKKVLEK
tara:strand:- start:503 stop:778 length:276 start_codon:yes stop_codon:yes gene_type:complete